MKGAGSGVVTGILIGGLAVLLAFLVSGCGPNQTTRDLEGVPAKEPQKAEVYVNVDKYGNVARLCIDGVAFATTTRDYQALMRVPEWDKTWCAS